MPATLGVEHKIKIFRHTVYRFKPPVQNLRNVKQAINIRSSLKCEG
jgi:hypothetical protein